MQSVAYAALHQCRAALGGVVVLSCALNLLLLTGSVFMLEVYDRVIPSRSVPTLVGLCVVVAGLYAFQAFFDALRGRLLARTGTILDRDLSGPVFEIATSAPLRPRSVESAEASRDLDRVRSFFSGPGVVALFDLPWIPVYVVVCFGFHPWIGVACLVGGAVMLILTVAVELVSKPLMSEVAAVARRRAEVADSARRNAEAVYALGMVEGLKRIWKERNDGYLETTRRLTDVTGGLSSVSKTFRMFLQSAVLAVGALLVIKGEATGGIIIASSILTSRALAPVESVIANWKTIVAARLGWRRLRTVLARHVTVERTALPKPRKALAVEGIVVTAPGGNRTLVTDVSFSLAAGDAVAVVGPSGSGKSSLARALVGAWPTFRGKVRIDGASLDQWDPAALAAHVGYLPQDVELLDGTIAQNVSRFAVGPSSDDIVSASEDAGIDVLVLRQPQGYDTQIGDGGLALSAGQRQRVGLARALYCRPFLVVLDEPNSNLDADGETALAKAIMGVRDRGGIVVVVSHRTGILACVSHVLVMKDGVVQTFGSRDQVVGTDRLSSPSKDVGKVAGFKPAPGFSGSGAVA